MGKIIEEVDSLMSIPHIMSIVRNLGFNDHSQYLHFKFGIFPQFHSQLKLWFELVHLHYSKMYNRFILNPKMNV